MIISFLLFFFCFSHPILFISHHLFLPFFVYQFISKGFKSFLFFWGQKIYSVIVHYFLMQTVSVYLFVHMHFLFI